MLWICHLVTVWTWNRQTANFFPYEISVNTSRLQCSLHPALQNWCTDMQRIDDTGAWPYECGVAADKAPSCAISMLWVLSTACVWGAYILAACTVFMNAAVSKNWHVHTRCLWVLPLVGNRRKQTTSTARQKIQPWEGETEDVAVISVQMSKHANALLVLTESISIWSRESVCFRVCLLMFLILSVFSDVKSNICEQLWTQFNLNSLCQTETWPFCNIKFPILSGVIYRYQPF